MHSTLDQNAYLMRFRLWRGWSKNRPYIENIAIYHRALVPDTGNDGFNSSNTNMDATVPNLPKIMPRCTVSFFVGKIITSIANAPEKKQKSVTNAPVNIARIEGV